MRPLKFLFRIFMLGLFSLLLFSYNVNAQEDSTLIKKVMNKTKISGQWFLAYSYIMTENMNLFNLKRGYFTVKTNLSPKISVRYTQDIVLDKEGSDAGNVEIRMKYLYLKLKPFNTGLMKYTFLEAGLVHRPWLDFEQKINDYRVQDKMYIEKIGIFNSADFGITIGGYFGGKLDNNIQNKIDSHYPGKFGSYSIGIYNGAGYHDNEFNNNKTLEGRLSLRPFPNYVPGLQFSYSTAFGKANLEDNDADFRLHLFYLSFKNSFLTLTGQYYNGLGDSFGRYYEDNEAFRNNGYSFFGEFRIPKTSFGFLGRYDEFTSEQSPEYKSSSIYGGVSYRFLKNKLLLFYNNNAVSDQTDELFELVLEIAF